MRAGCGTIDCLGRTHLCSAIPALSVDGVVGFLGENVGAMTKLHGFCRPFRYASVAKCIPFTRVVGVCSGC